MLTVACVLRSGGIYTPAHVGRLHKQVLQRLSLPFQFTCLVDDPLPGFWAKIGLFEPGRFQGRVLYLDLDVTVVGSLDDLATYPVPFAAIQDYQNPLTINSSVMAWDAGFADQVFTDFTPDVMGRLHGDQNWIHEKVPATHFPRAWCPSYRADIVPRGMPKDARVAVFHGRPKPWEVPEFA